MSEQSFRCEVQATYDHLWSALMEELEHPERFNQGILKSRILERFNRGVLRVVSVPDADVRERITFDDEKGTISSQLVGHPVLVGVIEKKVYPHPSSQGIFILESHIEWESINEKVDQMIRRNVERFVTQSLRSVQATAEAKSR